MRPPIRSSLTAWLGAAAVAVAAASCAFTSAAAAAQVQPYRAGDYGGFSDVLPPGSNGRTNLVELAAFLATGRRPAHNDDQRGMYARLLSATPGVTQDILGLLFKTRASASRPATRLVPTARVPG